LQLDLLVDLSERMNAFLQPLGNGQIEWLNDVWNPASLCSKIDVEERLASCPAPKLFVDSKGQPSLPHGALIAVNFVRFSNMSPRPKCHFIDDCQGYFRNWNLRGGMLFREAGGLIN
jgi:hypothetical protein